MRSGQRHQGSEATPQQAYPAQRSVRCAARRARALMAVACGLTVVLVALGCRAPQPHHAPARPPLAPVPVAAAPPAPSRMDILSGDRLLTASEAAEFAGDAACARCHPALCQGYAATRHANTLKAVTVAEHGAYFRAAATIKDASVGYAYRPAIADRRCVMIGFNSSGEQRALPADYVIGTGRNALTFFCAVRPDAWVDLRLSYYTRRKQWDYTPMQKPGDRTFTRAAGIEQSGPMLPACLKCHVTYLRAGATGLDMAASHIGIGCERCHGPGNAHIALLNQPGRRFNSDSKPGSLQLEDLHRATPERINELCGACHHNEQNSQPGDAKTENGLARFQGVALVRSRCYQQSKSLSCVTCHNPHEDTANDVRKNDAICLRCHSAAPGATASTPPTKLCPVNPRAGCTDCHMPRQTIATIPFAKYRNHWIKVWPDISAR